MSTKHGSLSNQSHKRLRGGELILKGFDNDEIVEILEVSESSVKRWRKKLHKNDGNIACLARGKGSGRPPSLSDDEKQRLRQIILDGAIKAGYPSERWTSRNVTDLIRREFGVEMTSRNVRYLLPALGLSPQMPVVKSHKHDDAEIIRWCGKEWERIKKKRRNSAQR